MTTRPSTFNFADIWEAVAEEVPERTALVCGARRTTFGELATRVSALAEWMAAKGVTSGAAIGVMMRNRNEHVETLLAAYSLRAVPVNINYRLRRNELTYLFRDSGLSGIVIDSDLEGHVQEILPDVNQEIWTLTVGDDYERAIGTARPQPRSLSRSGDDHYLVYTGGTTGTPKGVLWRMEDAYFACLGGGDPTGVLGPVQGPDQVLDRLIPDHAFLTAAPLMHAAGTWSTLRWLFAGSKVVLIPEFLPSEIWQFVAQERVNVMNIVGDAMARPLLDALETTDSLDLTCLRTIASGGVGLTPRSRSDLLAALPWLTIKDSYGSSETGVHGWSVHTSALQSVSREQSFTTRDTVLIDPHTLDLLPVDDASSGLVARHGHVPLKYWNDKAKSASTFLQLENGRYALTGDLGKLDGAGNLTLLGRGSQCINSGGEKIFPEEVERTLREHPLVKDAVVVGVDDERWGQRVVGIIARVPGSRPTAEQLRTHCEETLAAFKVPKEIISVDRVSRTEVGKPDYVWAAALARASQGERSSEPAR